MIKLVFRFFIICLLITLLSVPIFLYIQNKLEASSDLGNMKLLSAGKFYLLDEILVQYPEQQWQNILDKLRPPNAYHILVIPFDQLDLTKNQMTDLKNHNIVFTKNILDSDWPIAIYKRINNSQFAYKHLSEFSSYEEAHRLFEWQQFMVIHNLTTIPKNKWPEYLKTISKFYGWPITVHKINDLHLTLAQKQRLLNKQWVIVLPNHSDDTIQILYTPIPNSNQILQFGPVHLPFADVYKTYVYFFSVLIMLEIVIFFLAILFARTLEKLKALANEYGQGNFDSKITIGKTSSLFSLYNNLHNMGERIKRLLVSHKELTNSVSHELRTPISRLRFSLEFLKEAEDKQELLKRIPAMEEDISELENLVSEILAFAQLDRLNPSIESSQILVKDIKIFVVEKIKPVLSKELSINIADDIKNEVILANNKYLQRLLQNLLLNANRFANSKILFSVNKITNGYEFIAEDDGAGISLEDRDKIFEPFFQLDNQINDNLPHYGLGLAICKKIVDWHRWRIRIMDSKLGGAKIQVNTTV